MKESKIQLPDPIIKITEFGCVFNNHPFLNQKMAAEFIQMSEGNLIKLTSEGKIKKRKYNNTVYYDYNELKRYVGMYFKD
tara:strand:- start:533 stop:772 length:240 start_codon:yes stop_codon:yes gene_type:complete